MYWLAFLILFSTPKADHCEQMAKSICSELGEESFFCRVFNQIANHENRKKKLCSEFYSRDWDKRLESLKKQEALLKKMAALGKKGNAEMKVRSERFKEKIRDFYLKNFIGGYQPRASDPSPIPEGKNPCPKLREAVCRDLGKGSFYCALFTRLTKLPGVKWGKCSIFLSNWKSSQLKFFRERERFIQNWFRKVQKNPKARNQFYQIIRDEELRMRRFFLGVPPRGNIAIPR